MPVLISKLQVINKLMGGLNGFNFVVQKTVWKKYFYRVSFYSIYTHSSLSYFFVPCSRTQVHSFPSEAPTADVVRDSH